MLRVTQSLSMPGGERNEDLIWTGDTVLAVLDGATSLIPSRFDACWFTDRFIRAFREELERGKTLPDSVNRALVRIRKDYAGEGEGENDGIFPSASGIFVQEKEDRLLVLSIGDCEGLFFLDDGSCVEIYDDTVERLDNGVLRRCLELRERTGGSIPEILRSPEIRARLIENRKKMNRPDGYRILSPGMPPCGPEDLKSLPARRVRRIVLFSDGFRAVRKEFYQPSFSLEALYEQLRRQEREDPAFLRIPRFKPGDDASALVAELAEA